MKLVLLLVIVVSLVLGTYFLFAVGSTTPVTTGGAAGPTGGQAGVSAEPEAAILETPLEESQAGTLPAATTREAVRETSANLNFAPDPERSLRATLQLPAGHPAGEDTEIWAFYGVASSSYFEDMVPFGQSPQHIAERSGARRFARVAGSGTELEIPVPEDELFAVLVPVGRLLVPRPLELELTPQAFRKSYTLKPSLGSCVELAIELPASATDEERDQKDFSVVLEQESRGFSGMNAMPQIVGPDWHRPTVELTMTLRGIVPEIPQRLNIDAKHFVDPLAQRFELEPGEVIAQRVVLERGATLIAHILDPNGKPAAGANLNLNYVSGMGGAASGAEMYQHAQSNEAGVATLTGLQAGPWSVDIYYQNAVQNEQVVTLGAEEQRELEIQLSGGVAFTGLVRWPDGTPAEQAIVEAHFTQVRGGGSHVTYSKSQSSMTGADGRFLLGGLSEESVLESIKAQGHVTTPEQAKAMGAQPGDTFVARLEPGPGEGQLGRELVLELEPSLTLIGRLVNEAGEPVLERVQLTAWPMGEQKYGTNSLHANTGSGSLVAVPTEAAAHPGGYTSSDSRYGPGGFGFPGVFEGTWMVEARSAGYQVIEPVQVEVPAFEEFEILLPLATSVTGVVLDPDGQRVAGAEVLIREEDVPFRISNEGPVLTDGEGEFSLTLGRPSVEVYAQHPAWAASESVLAESGSSAPLELRLRRGATIRGIVRQADGSPWPGRSVVATDLPGGPMMMARMGGGPEPAVTDGDGRFELANVDPGKLTVSAAPGQAEIEERMNATTGDRELIMFEVMGEMLTTRVEVGEGETVEIELGAKPKRPVKLQGRVSYAGDGVESTIMVLAEDGPPLAGAKAAYSGSDGSFELELDRPGSYTFIVNAQDVPNEAETFTLTVPEAETHSADFELTTSVVRGIVRGPDGRPAPRISLAIVPSDGANSPLDLSLNGGESSGSDGTFEFLAVKPGTYTLRANTSTSPNTSGANPNFGYAVLYDVRVGINAEVDGLELRLPAGAEVTGTIRDAGGQPVSGADVYVREAGGRSVSVLPGTTSNASGSYTVQGLSPGEVTVFARKDDEVTVEALPVSVSVGQSATCDLEMRVGSYLVLIAERDGEPVRIRASVIDEAGRNWSGLWSQATLMTWMSEGTSNREVRLGPLPGGRYTVQATALDGDSDAKKTVTVREGQEERTVRLRLK